MKILLAFDSFKDSIAAKDVVAVVKQTLEEELKENVEIQSRLLSDGGEGFLASLSDSLSLEMQRIDVTSPLGSTIQAEYASFGIPPNRTAVIEMATSSGLELVSDPDRNPLHTTAIGVGQMIYHAIHSRECSKILLGLGGSATSEGGITLLSAFNIPIIMKDGTKRSDVLYGKDLLNFQSFHLERKLFPGVHFDIAVDVMNPFVGPNGAVHVFGKQKGATPEIQEKLEVAMQNLSRFIYSTYSVDLSALEGSGAAGGISGLLSVVLESVALKKGSEIVAESIGLKEAIAWADVVITGEGCYDSQTAEGKVISQVADYCSENNTPLVVFCGKAEVESSDPSLEIYDMSKELGFELSMYQPKVALASTTRKLLQEHNQFNTLGGETRKL